MKKEKKNEGGLLQDIEFDALSLLKVPAGEIGAFNYSVLRLKIKNGEVTNVEMSPPNMKQIAMSEGKIAFMKTFFFGEVSEAVTPDAP